MKNFTTEIKPSTTGNFRSCYIAGKWQLHYIPRNGMDLTNDKAWPSRADATDDAMKQRRISCAYSIMRMKSVVRAMNFYHDRWSN